MRRYPTVKALVERYTAVEQLIEVSTLLTSHAPIGELKYERNGLCDLQ